MELLSQYVYTQWSIESLAADVLILDVISSGMYNNDSI
jgi:hypothetical protein